MNDVENLNIPRFSIVISVYNSAQGLRYCLDNLVFQTFDNIEIIIVDKESTDDSKSIEREYERRFPEKIRVFDRPYSDNPAAGRNYGISVARADYIAFCDADDYYDIRAFEYLDSFLNKKSNAYDLVCYGTNMLKNGKLVKTDIYRKNTDRNKLLFGDNPMGFWNKLFKKSLLEECGEIFDSLLDDIGFIPIVLSKANKIGFLEKTLYYFEQYGGSSKQVYSTKPLDMLKSIDHVFNNISTNALGQFSVCAATRICSQIIANWPYRDIYIEWLYEHRDRFAANRYIYARNKLNSDTLHYIEIAEDLIPPIIYINGFNRSDVDVFNAEWIYGKKTNVVILDENTCDVTGDQLANKAYLNGEYDFIAQYYAVKKIAETGGFYIGKRVKYSHPINSLRIYKNVFSPLSSQEYSSDFFGAVSGSDVILKLSETYKSGFYDNDYLPLGERIRNVLVAVYGIAVPSCHSVQKGICITGVNETLYDLDDDKNIFVQEIPETISDNWVHVDPVLLSYIYQNVGNAKSSNNDVCARKELNNIKSSDSYKLAERMKRFANTKFGTPFKKLFKWFLKIYRKRKYGV